MTATAPPGSSSATAPTLSVVPAPRTLTRVRPRSFRADDAAALGGSALAAAALVWLLFDVFLPIDNTATSVIAWLLSFLAIYRFTIKETEGRLAARDRVMAAVIGMAAVLVITALASILIFVTVQGIRYISVNLLTQTMKFTGPASPASEGGILHAVVGTLQQVFIAAAISVPLGVLTAVYLNEVGGRLARPVRMFVNAMSGVPSIVAGLFIFAMLNVGLGWGFSGIQASFALSILMLPTITRTSEEVMRLVPGGLREASLALGAPEWRSVWQVVLPTARAGIVTAIILGIARVIGETAPLFMTAGGAPFMNANPTKDAQASLPLFIYQRIKQFGDAEKTIPRGFAAALVLLVLVLVLFIIARIVGRPKVDRASTRRRLRRGKARKSSRGRPPRASRRGRHRKRRGSASRTSEGART